MNKKSALPSFNVRLVSPTVRTALITCTLFFGAAHAADLREVYEQAKTYDAEYRTAQFNLDAASRRVPLAESAFRPQLTFGADAGLGTLEDDGEGVYKDTALSLTLSQSLYNRSDKKLIDQAKLGALQAEAQYAAAGQTLILRVATAYFDVLRARASREFSQSELQAISRQREQAERRFDVGLVPITDVRSAQAQYDLAVAQEIAAANVLATAREALLRISGLGTNNLAILAKDLPLTPPNPADIDRWVKIAKEQNLELVIARLASESSNTQIDIELGNDSPTLSLLGTAASTTTDQFGRSDANRGEITLQFRLPILTGGRVKALVAQARDQSRSSAENLVAQERATTQQTRDGYRGVLASISRVKALRQALVSTQKSAEATEAGFRAGTRTSVEVLQALRDTYRARSDYAGAKYDYIINSLNLKAASGTLAEEDIFAINRFLVASEEN
ncbi:MAG: outer membrane protein [Granulosicoccus sp.]|jgi:outer membrane protein